jgi:glycosyltransferase involved in cell wall biosynthesis
MATSQGINVIGYVSGNLGLGVAARSTVERLTAWGHPVSVADIDPGGGRAGRDTAHAGLECAGVCPHPMNLFHMNPMEIVYFSDQWRRHIDLSVLNVCVPFWELPHVPMAWLPVLRTMDAILAPTAFIRRAIEDDAPGLPVLSYPQTVSIPSGVQPNRERWGIREQATAFLVTFDPGSDTTRKNPWDGIAAFQDAFAGVQDVALIIKINGTVGTQRAPELMRLDEVVGADPRLRLVEDRLTYPEVLSLYASADSIVSLHRSEGLGLHLMEAMALGKPVIATGWSGNVDFMTPNDSCLVGFDLVPVRSDHPAYTPEAARPEQVWAQPHVDEAAVWMRRLHDDPLLRERLGGNASAAMTVWRAAADAVDPFSAIPGLVGSLTKHGKELAHLTARYRLEHFPGRMKRRLIDAVRGR